MQVPHYVMLPHDPFKHDVYATLSLKSKSSYKESQKNNIFNFLCIFFLLFLKESLENIVSLILYIL